MTHWQAPIVLVFGVVLGAAACAPEEGEQTTDPPNEGSGLPVPADQSELVATQGPIQITADQVLDTLRWRELISGESWTSFLPPDWQNDPSALRPLVDSVLETELIWIEAERLGLTVSSVERQAERATIPTLAPEGSGESALDAEAVNTFLDERLLYDAWLQAVSDNIDAADVWDAYQAANDLAALDVVLIPNVPTQQEIANFVDDSADTIARHYETNVLSYYLPRRARISLIRCEHGLGAEVDARIEARDRCMQLAERVHVEGFEAVAMEASDDSSAERGGDYGWVVPRQIPEAFQIPVGELSPTMEARTSWYFFRVEEVAESRPRELDEILEREIAAALLTDAGPSESAQAAAAQVRAAWETGDEAVLRAVIAEVSAERRTTPDFAHTDLSVVPGVGQSAELADAAFAADLSVGDLLPETVHVGDSLVVAALARRSFPTREDFEVEREQFERDYRTTILDLAWEARIGEFRNEHPRDYHLPTLVRALQSVIDSPSGE